MTTRDEELDERIRQYTALRSAFLVYCDATVDKTVDAHKRRIDDALAAIHAHVEARVLAAYNEGVASGRASQVLRVEMPKPEPPQFIVTRDGTGPMNDNFYPKPVVGGTGDMK